MRPAAGAAGVLEPTPRQSHGWSSIGDEVQELEFLGKGAFGVVHHGTFRGHHVAIKRFGSAPDQKQLKQFEKEVAALERLQKHPSLVSFVGAESQPDRLILTEFMPGGSLFRLLHIEKELLTLRQQARLALQIAKGLDFLHSLKPPLIHRDLKSANVVLDLEKNAKICDFGLTRPRLATRLPQTTSASGTWEYMAPEAMDRNLCITEKVDIWAFGCILAEISSGRSPNHDCANAVQIVHKICVEQQLPTIPAEVHESLRAIIRACFHHEQRERATARDLCSRLIRPGLDDMDHDAWYQLGTDGGGEVMGVFYNKGQCYANALTLDDKISRAWNQLGLVGGGKVKGVFYTMGQCYEAALFVDPIAWHGLGTRGGGKVRGHSYTERQCYEKALTLDGKFLRAWKGLGDTGGGEVRGDSYTEKHCYELAGDQQLAPVQQEEKIRLCREGHHLTEFETMITFHCTECRKDIEPGTKLFGCKRCNYDICNECDQLQVYPKPKWRVWLETVSEGAYAYTNKGLAAADQALQAVSTTMLSSCSASSSARVSEQEIPELYLVKCEKYEHCNGLYELQEMDRGRPLWKKRGAERWLYYSDIGTWTIGGERAKEKDFKCRTGWVASRRRDDSLPDQQLWTEVNGDGTACINGEVNVTVIGPEVLDGRVATVIWPRFVADEEALAGGFPGTWTKAGRVMGIISADCTTLTVDGKAQKIKIEGNTIKRTVKAKVYDGMLDDAGRIIWSNGSTWERQARAADGSAQRLSPWTAKAEAIDVACESSQLKGVPKSASDNEKPAQDAQLLEWTRGDLDNGLPFWWAKDASGAMKTRLDDPDQEIWTCDFCAEPNKQSRELCNNCRKPRPTAKAAPKAATPASPAKAAAPESKAAADAKVEEVLINAHKNWWLERATKSQFAERTVATTPVKKRASAASMTPPPVTKMPVEFPRTSSSHAEDKVLAPAVAAPAVADLESCIASLSAAPTLGKDLYEPTLSLSLPLDEAPEQPARGWEQAPLADHLTRPDRGSEEKELQQEAQEETQDGFASQSIKDTVCVL